MQQGAIATQHDDQVGIQQTVALDRDIVARRRDICIGMQREAARMQVLDRFQQCRHRVLVLRFCGKADSPEGWVMRTHRAEC